MSRGVGGRNGEMRNVNSAIDTINAAATAIASAESRLPPPSAQKRRWSGCWSIYSCFGSPQKTSKKIGHAVLFSEPTTTSTPPSENPTQPPVIRIPFVAPPSSPASFLPSEPPSALQSPVGSMGPTSIRANMYSPPGGPRSIFAIGPYAHETQLVTPPVFSSYTTEPSTAPYTPPPESVHLTTPSSPEVPFAQLLNPSHRRSGDNMGPRFTSSHYEFQSYLLYPGSPAGPLISPGSAFSGSGTSSPFTEGFMYYPDVRYATGPAAREWGSQQASGTVTPDAVIWPRSRDFVRQDSVVAPLPNLPARNNDTLIIDHRVSFELTAEDVVRCVEKKPMALPRALQNPDERQSGSSVDDVGGSTNGEEGQRYPKQRAASLGSIKEFNFDHVNGLDPDKPCVNSNWWANEKVVGKEGETKNWSFFPMMHPGVS